LWGENNSLTLLGEASPDPSEGPVLREIEGPVLREIEGPVLSYPKGISLSFHLV